MDIQLLIENSIKLKYTTINLVKYSITNSNIFGYNKYFFVIY